jgi:uncharacterized protein
MEHAGSQQGELRRGWAVVTGASSGLGRQFAIALAARAYPVLAVARRAERLSARADEVAGGLYRFLTVAGRYAPRAVLARMMGRVMRPTSAPRAAGT